MDVLQLTSRERESYEIQLTYSILWECALGIAAITNTRLLDTLEKPKEYWIQTRESVSAELSEELDYVEQNNTWKALLQILHQQEFSNLDVFQQYVQHLTDTELKFICLPFIGNPYQADREQAAQGEEKAIKELMRITANNPFFPSYIEFISSCEAEPLKKHLIKVMNSWYQEIVRKSEQETKVILEKDYQSKKEKQQKMSSEELVQWATGGVTYTPEPSVHTVLLIPQYIYRPWNIEADMEGTKVFYYPVSNESVSPSDRYMPDYFLVQKYKALGDEVRLKMVKMLSEHPRTLQDMTEKLDIGKSTIHHHLKILRAAKLVEIIDSKYCLKNNVFTLLAKEFDWYLEK
ncbi:metalloregulator ArsR/SmtB family transcription factor [Oceanobacillus sp. FSL W8-0428]|uniref:ArsR/SmtB family transcription factor n=1 Tax=Oceanobacillus TaxID=182709 RepID=UPI0009883D42|nr:metalloregulator ArsR/SmtB family transcription factor [Oceanobacillus sojae]MCT1902436.1 ArsR family transcriptional regulator [Oceanobacillus sojae]